MRTTLILDDKLYQDVSNMTGITEKTKLIHMGLEALLRERAAERLSKLHGAIKKAKQSVRRKS